MEWMLLPLRRYADFSGRSRRKEYWMFALGMIIATLVAMTLDAMLGLGSGYSAYGLFSVVLLLGVLVPALAVQVRRFHDQDRSGWFVLLNLIPLIGGLIVFVFMVLEGTRGANRYGPDPLTQDVAA